MAKKFVNKNKSITLIDGNDRLFDRQTVDSYKDELIDSLYEALKDSFYCSANAPLSYWEIFHAKRELAMSKYNKRNK